MIYAFVKTGRSQSAFEIRYNMNSISDEMVLSPYKNAFTNIFTKILDIKPRETKKRKSSDEGEEEFVDKSLSKKQKPNPPCRQCQAGLPGHISHLMS